MAGTALRRRVLGTTGLGAAVALGVSFGLLPFPQGALAHPTRSPAQPARADDSPLPTAMATDTVSGEPLLGPVSTRHTLRVGRDKLAYIATFAELPLADAAGTVQATISSTSYVLEGIKDRRLRPVMFMFNGGPGASSSPLHFGAFGPRRLTEERDPARRRMLDNPYTLLDVADLVFIDPVGTGFSRERTGSRSGAYWSVHSDAAVTLQLIHHWLDSQARQDSPVFIVGESYGGFRLATMMGHAEDLPLAGLILISPLLDASAAVSAPGNDLPYIFDLPSMAVAAWEHQLIDRAGRTIDQLYAEAEHFAQSDYAVALQLGSELPAGERDRLAVRMAALIGLPAQTIAAANLRIDSQQFLEQLIEGRVVGRLDTRISVPRPDPSTLPDRPAAANDPALGLGATNVIRSAPIKAYLLNELGVHTARDYLSLSLDLNFKWNWQEPASGEPRFYVNPTANLATVMAKQPRLRLLLIGGYYDMAVPILAPRYALTHAGVPLDRVSMQAFVAPHSAFQGDAALAHGSQVVRKFVAQATQRPTN